MVRRILAFATAFMFAGASLPAAQNSLGVVTQSSGGHLNSAVASAGATLYIGDRLATDSKGAMALRAGTVQLILSEDSTLFMNRDEAGLIPRLDRGSVGFHVEGNENFRVTAADVTVRPQSPVPTVGQVTLETCSVLVTSRVKSLEVTAGKETKIVEEGKSYRVALGGPCAMAHNRGPIATAHSRFWAVPVAVVGVATYIAVDEALESPDRP
jgi:ferric-dicitrate binding protein FerR (iron transport regulator)